MQALPASGRTLGASAATDPVRAKLEDAAQQFEALFIQQMLKSTRQGAGPLGGQDGFLQQNPDDPLLGLADQLLADNLAGQRAFGIADLLLRQLLPAAPLKPAATGAALSAQEVTPASPPPCP